MKNHIKLGVVVLALAGAVFFLIQSRPPDPGTAVTDTHEHEGEEEGTHEGELAGEHEGEHEGETNQGGEVVTQPKPTPPPKATTGQPQLPPAKGKRTRVKIDTAMGPIEVLLYDDLAPKTAKNFLNLVEKGYYKDMIFHRVVKGFVIQTGDPTGTGGGGPGYSIPDEIVPELKHNQPGVMTMANRGPNTGGSQFYFTMKPEPNLDSGQYGNYTVFGQVVKGMEVVAAINGVVTNQDGRPVSPVAFKGVEVLGQE